MEFTDKQIGELIKGMINKGRTAKGKQVVYLSAERAPIDLINGLIKLGYWVKLKGTQNEIECAKLDEFFSRRDGLNVSRSELK